MDQAPVSGLSLRRLIFEITHRMTLARLKSSPLVTFKVRVNRRRVHILSNQVHQSDDMCSRLVNSTDIRSPTRFFHPSYISFHGGQNWGRLKRYINAKLQPHVIFGELGSFFLRCMREGVMEIGDWSFRGNLYFSSAPDICCAEQIILFNILFLISELCT